MSDVLLVYAGNYQQFITIRRELLRSDEYNIARIRYVSHIRQLHGQTAKVCFYGTYRDRRDYESVATFVHISPHLEEIEIDNFSIVK